MAAPRPPDPLPPDDVLVNALAVVRGRAQATRRRVQRVPRLSRSHIATDLAQIEAQVDRLVAVLRAGPGHDGSTPPAGDGTSAAAGDRLGPHHPDLAPPPTPTEAAPRGADRAPRRAISPTGTDFDKVSAPEP